METYHIMFKTNLTTTGKNYKGKSPEKALSLWHKEYPNAEFIYLKKLDI